jgi:isopentenyldiphosphate isomerase
VTGQLPRREVHRLKLRHRAVHLLVVNRAGQVFLQQRSMAKDLFPGMWDSSAAGHVGAGEDYDGTAARELAEELGCRPERPPQRCSKSRRARRRGRNSCGSIAWRPRGRSCLQTEEIERGGWFTVAEIDRWVAERPEELAPAFRFVL